jgi:hypothetical protein
MFSDKLHGVLGTISKNQRNRWRLFLQSAYFTEDIALLALFKAIEPELDGAEERTKEAVWKLVYPNKPFNDGIMRQLASQLNSLAYRFIALEHWKAQPTQPLMNVLEALRKTGLKKHTDGLEKLLETELDKLPEADSERLWTFFRFDTYRLRLTETYERQPNFEHLRTAALHLDQGYYIARLQQFCELPVYAYFRPVNDIPVPTEAWISAMFDSAAFETPGVLAWWLTYNLVTKHRDEDYFKLLEHLDKNEKAFDTDNLYQLYLHLQNYCIHLKINAGQSDWYDHLLDLYKKLLDKKLLLSNDRIDTQHYKNIVSLGIQTKNTAWTLGFIKNYTSLLPESDQEWARSYNEAKVHFSSGNFGQVMEILRDIEFKDQNTQLGARVILVKTYVELDEYRLLDSLLESFRIYLRRHKNLSADTKQQYLNFVRFAKKLSILPLDRSTERDKLVQEIAQCKSLVAREWFAEKLEIKN